MLARNKPLKGGVALLVTVAMLAFTASAFSAWPCCPKKTKACAEPAKAPCKAEAKCGEGDLTCVPPNAEVGECYARVLIPATFRTVTERYCVKEASERIECIPAKLKWVEERICSKEACTQLEAVPCEYKWVEKTIEVSPARTEWVIQNAANCTSPDKANLGCVYCLKTIPAAYKTIRTQVCCKPACTREVACPAEYQTLRRQVVECPATSRKICIPAEYEDVQKTVLVCPERMKWEHVVCEAKLTSDTVNKIKTALVTAGYVPGPLNGTLAKADWDALNAFQQKNGLGVGQLSYDTLKALKVSID